MNFLHLIQILMGHILFYQRKKNFHPKTKFYFAGSSEMYGKVRHIPQTEKTPFYTRSVYGISKVAGFDLTRKL